VMMVYSHPLPHVDEHVRLTMDIPHLGLRCGEAGSVCSAWFTPTIAFEVEFRQSGESYTVRALLLEDQIEADEQPLA